MARLIVLAVAVVAAVGPAARPAPPRVPVHVSVVDAAGRSVTDLQAGDFEIRDKRKPRPIDAFLPAVPSRSVVMLLDVSTSMTGMFDALLLGAELVLTELPAADRVRVGSFSDRAQLGPVITGDRLDAIRSLRSRLQPGGSSALFDAVAAGMEAQAGEPDRRVVILLTDGGDTSSRLGLNEVVARAQAEDLAVYSLMFADTAPSRMTPTRSAQFQEPMRLAAETGGGYVEWRGGSLNQAAGQLIGQLRSEYRLEFTPAELDGKRHRLEVVVKRKGLRVRVRSSFVARPGGSPRDDHERRQ